jgi:predicted secreted protein
MTGKDIIVIISIRDTPMFATAIKSDDIQTQANAIEKASATQQDWEEVIPGRKRWSLTVNYLVLLSGKLRDVLEVGKMFDITIRDRSNNVTLTGQALLTDCKQTHTVNSLCQGSFTFRGNGPLQ